MSNTIQAIVFIARVKKPLEGTSTLGRSIKEFTTTTVTTFTSMNRYQNVEPEDMKMSSILLYVNILIFFEYVYIVRGERNEFS